MNKTWFHGVDHLLVWILSAVILCTLNLAFYDMGSKDQGFFPEDTPIPKRVSNDVDAPGRKVMIIFVEGLKTGHLIRNIHQSRVLTRVVIHEGVWGEVSWDPPPPGFVGFEPFFTGNPEGFGPSILAAADRVTFVGRTDLVRGLKLPANFTKLINPAEELQSFDDYKTHDDLAIEYLIKVAETKELWDMKLNKEVVIVHLTGVGRASRREGYMSLRGSMALYDTFQNIDKLFGHLNREYPYMSATYFVTSIGMQVPIIAWGHGIDQARFPDSRMFQPNPSYTVPSIPRKIEVVSMAPLIACVLDSPPPPNSVGTLPDNYLGMAKSDVALCQSEVAIGVKKLYYHQAKQVLNGGWVKLAAFDDGEVSQDELEQASKRLKITMDAGDYTVVGSISKKLVSHCLGNIVYYRNFRFLVLSNITLFMLIGCLLCCLTLLCPSVSESNNLDENREWLRLPSLKVIPTLDVIFFIALTILIIVVGIDNFPARYHLYVTATVIPWWLAIRNTRNWLELIQRGRNQRGSSGQKLIDFFYFVLILLTGCIAANRIPIMGVYLVSMVFLCLTALITASDSKVTLWMFTTMPMVACLSYSYDKDTIYKFNLLAACLWIIVSWAVTFFSHSKLKDCPIVISNTLIAIIMVCGHETMVYHLAWFVLPLVPLIGSSNLMNRFVQIFMSLGIPFFLLTRGNEAIHLFVFVVHALTWMTAESYDDLNDLAVQTIPTERRSNGRRSGPMDMRMNYFYNLYALLAGALVYPEQVNDVPNVLKRLLNCEFKLAVPILCLTVIHGHMIKRNGGQRYYSLLLSFFYFTYLILVSFLDVYKSTWEESFDSSHEFTLVHGPLNVWCAILACSWIGDFLLCPSIFCKRRTNDLPLH